MTTILAALALIALAAPPQKAKLIDSGERTADGRKIMVEQNSEITIDEQKIDGTLQRPTGILIFSNPRQEFAHQIPERTSFAEKLQASLDDI